MKPVKQTILSDPPNDIRGNCFSACLASLLDLSIEDVPYFAILGEGWFAVFLDFLTANGYVFEGTPNFGDWVKTYEGIDGFFIVGGESPRGIRNGHSVIYKDGNPYFDPHPSNDFLTNPVEVYLIKRK